MPRYDYKCPRCGDMTEVARPIERRDDPVYCPKCDFQSEMYRKVPVRVGFKVTGYNAKNGYSDD